MRITCPYCGSRGSEEFTCLGNTPPPRPADDAPMAAWVDFVYVRDNPSGPVTELWQHVQGCRTWLVVSRDTRTHAIIDVQLASRSSSR
jgi:methylglutamate dehydrogenase subunit B